MAHATPSTTDGTIRFYYPDELVVHDKRIRSLGEVRSLTVEIGAAGQLTAPHAERVAGYLVALRRQFPDTEIVFSFAGFADDPRWLWEIPEVCAYVALLIRHAPFYAALRLGEFGETSKSVIALCLGNACIAQEGRGLCTVVDDEAWPAPVAPPAFRRPPARQQECRRYG